MIVYAVDDKKMPLEALCDAIRKAEPGAELHCFRTSEDALQTLGETPCDVAFLDINLPGMNGIELAKEMKIRCPEINIIFATGYNQYASSALELHCSGYLMKPITPEKVRRELDDLRHPVFPKADRRVRVQTFGNFEVYIDEQPVRFHYEKSRECLAYLIDRKSLCSNQELMAVIWDNEISSSYLRMVRKDLLDSFREKGCEDVFIRQRGKLGVDANRISCDYYDWQKGIPTALNLYLGEYMAQYSWAEFTQGELNRKNREEPSKTDSL